MLSLKCKNCGADVSYDKKTRVAKCEHCGSKYLIETKQDKNIYSLQGDILVPQSCPSSIVVIPDNVKVISKGAFANHLVVEKVVIGKSIEEIGEEAFYNCSRLKEVVFSDSVIRIGARAFKGCSIEKVEIKQSVEEIGKEAFMDCKKLEFLILPNKIFKPMERTFKNCENLANVDCNIKNFYPSVKPSIETYGNTEGKPTIFDTFHGTKFYHNIYEKIKNKECIFCGNKIKKPMFSAVAKCMGCGESYNI